jgi:ABC-type amino acid transport substrate-binding protein
MVKFSVKGTWNRGWRDIVSVVRIVAPVAALTLAAPAFAAGAEEAQPLRLCADPTNLPFSSDNPATPGVYLEIGQALAKALGRPISYDWYKSYFGKRTVRVTLLGKQCDAMIGLTPSDDFMGPAVIFSKSITREGYALVTAKGRKLGRIDDLKPLRVAVQYQTTPQNLLALRDDIQKVTVLSPEEGMKALDQGKADVAFIWGPVAGWLNKTEYGDRYAIQTTDGEGLLWPVAVGFAKGSKELRDQIDAQLPAMAATISEIAAKYGLPSDTPIKLSAAPEPAIRHASLDTTARPSSWPRPQRAPPRPLRLRTRRRQNLKPPTRGMRSSTAPAPIATARMPFKASAGSISGCCSTVMARTCATHSGRPSMRDARPRECRPGRTSSTTGSLRASMPT